MSKRSDELTKQLHEAMKSKDPVRVSTLRLLITAVKNAEVQAKGDISDETFIEVVSREIKRREEAAREFEAGGHSDRAASELAEAEILRPWMPDQLSSDEVEALVDEAIAKSGASGPQEMGKVMGVLMPQIKGKADGKAVSELVKSKLTGQ